jgi:Fe-S-cluster containining protein
MRNAPCPCGSGRRYKSCCWARDRAAQDAQAAGERARAAGEQARAAARTARDVVDGVLRVFLPLVESRGEYHVACGPGCDACCANFVRASFCEAEAIAEFLRAPEQAAVLARFRAKLEPWRERGAPELAELRALLARNDGPPARGADREAYGRAGVAFGQKANRCPFDEGGRCEVYPVRPIVCRAVYALDTAEFCTPGRGTPKRVSHPALEAAVRESGQARADVAVAAGRPIYEDALPEMVAAALERSR